MHAVQPITNASSSVLQRLSTLAPRPATLEASGLSVELLTSLVLKHLWSAGALATSALAERLGLTGAVLEPAVLFVRREALVQLQSRGVGDNDLRFALTERGRQAAREAFEKCGYVGPAPVPLAAYARVTKAQAVPRRSVSRERAAQCFGDVVMSPELRDRLGVAMTSGKAIFLYGPPGTGKTYIATRLNETLSGEVLIPHAIAVNDKIVRVLDRSVHECVDRVEDHAGHRLLIAQGFDGRFALCKRPLVIIGGELTLEMLDVRYDPSTVEYHAPLQMKANGGVLVIDDLGRQSFLVQRIFDRSIVLLEHQVDHLAAGSDTVFETPCDPIVIFSTNLEPADLADEAILRRLGYKIKLGPMPAPLYAQIWERACAAMNVGFERRVLDYALTHLYPQSGRPTLACHPRDLIWMALDKATYDDRPASFDIEDLRWAWTNYFLADDDAAPANATR